MTANLLELAARCEEAEAAEQRSVIEQAATHLALYRRWPARGDDRALAAIFFASLNAGVFLDAALTLMPEGMKWRCGYSRHVPHNAEIDLGDGRGLVIGESDHSRALAMTAAILRAHEATLGAPANA